MLRTRHIKLSQKNRDSGGLRRTGEGWGVLEGLGRDSPSRNTFIYDPYYRSGSHLHLRTYDDSVSCTQLSTLLKTRNVHTKISYPPIIMLDLPRHMTFNNYKCVSQLSSNHL